MTHRGAHAVPFAVLFGALLVAPTARAQGANLAAAQSLFDEGKQLVAAGKLAEACPKFAASFKLDPKPGTEVNLADCLEKGGQFASAWARYLEAASLSEHAGQTERAQYARDHAAALAPKLSRMSIAVKSPPRGLEVVDNGVAVDPALLGTAVPVDPGAHVIEARAPGKKPWSKTVEVAPGAQGVVVEVPPLEDGAAAVSEAPAVKAPPGAPEAPPSSAPAASFWTSTRVAGAVVGGVGVAGIAAGAALGVITLGKISDSKSQGHCNAALTVCDATGLQMNQDARSSAHGSTAALVIGSAAVVTGVVLLVVGGAPQKPSTGLRLGVAPVASADLKGAFVHGGW